MTRKALVLPLLVAGMAFFMQCSDEILMSDKNDVIAAAGKGPGGGGPGNGGGGGGDDGGEEAAGNNLSFPVFAADGFGITSLGNPSFEVEYTGEYPGLTDAEIAALEASGPWYPQKTEGNTWQADYSMVSETGIGVSYIDWGDVLESVKPTVGRPTRIEVTLYADATQGLGMNESMTGYTMALLEFPSSPNEQQGTNTTTYESDYATIVSPLPKLVIQYFGDIIPEELNWSSNGYWYLGETDVKPTNIIPISFAPELNVGGKYIYGASSGGWRPTQTGIYRLTFYIPASSDISLAAAIVANFSNLFSGPAEGGASVPVIDIGNNLTYDDVTVVTKGGGGGRR